MGSPAADLFAAADGRRGAEEGAGALDGYVVLRIDAEACPPALIEDIHGYLAARWLSGELRSVFEHACFGARLHGPTGGLDGAVAEEMPGFWRRTEEQAAGVPIWQPDARHPVGKWFAEAGAKLLPLPPPEVLDAILRRHGIEGSKEPMPQMREIEGGYAVIVHRPKAKSFKVAGVSQSDALAPLFWRS